MFKRIAPLDGIYPPFFSRYVEQEAGVVAFFNGNYREGESYRRRAFFLQGRSFPSEVRELLVEINAALPVQPPPGWAEKVRDRRTLFVITGQQPGLLAGPLLVLYKALAAVRLARRLELLLQVPVQPLFWMASEDHNVQPLLHSSMLAGEGRVARLSLNLPPHHLPAGKLELEQEALADLFAQLEGLDLPGGGVHQERVMEWLRTTISPGKETLSSWFMRIMSHLCAALGLIFFDPLAAAARGLYIPLLLRALESRGEMHRVIALAEEALVARGFPLQVKRRGQETFIMITWGEKRYPLLLERDYYYTPGGELSLSREELFQLIVARPALFSPNVLLRPLFQDSLFPSLAYVAGPAELAYFAQLKGLYAFFNLEPSLLFPRPGVTLLEPALLELAGRSGLGLETAEDLLEARRGPEPLREKLWPRSRLQERAFNPVAYLLVYGFPFWEKFSLEFPGEPGHYLYFIKTEEGG